MENKNYYDWLEINKNASQEVIEKAYKVLVKKYHPDLQQGENKIKAEEMIKNINQAYEVLSDENRRRQYDETLVEENISKEEYDRLKQELNYVKRQANTNTSNNAYGQTDYNNRNTSGQQNVQNQNNDQNQIYKQKMEDAIRKAYHDAYVQDLRNRGYKVKTKRSFNYYLRIIIIIVAALMVFGILWIIPGTREKMIDIYDNNIVVRIIADVIIGILKGFSSLFSFIS